MEEEECTGTLTSQVSIHPKIFLLEKLSRVKLTTLLVWFLLPPTGPNSNYNLFPAALGDLQRARRRKGGWG